MKKIISYIFAIFVIGWFSLSFFRMANNIFRLFTDEIGLVHISDLQKKEQMFGDRFRFWTFVEKYTPSDASVYVYMPEYDIDPSAFYYSLYNLYPRKIKFVKDLDQESPQIEGNQYYVLYFSNHHIFDSKILEFFKKGKKYEGEILSGILVKL